MWGILADTVAGIINEAIGSEDKKQIAIQQSKDQRNADIAKAVIEGAVAAYGIYSQNKQANQAVQGNPAVQGNIGTSYAEPIDVTPTPQMIGSSEPIYNIIYSSIWLNKASSEMGADVVEVNSGEVMKLKYRIQSMGNKVHKVLESVNNSDWQQVGLIDWKKMTMADLGRDDTGGPFFGEIARYAMSK